LTDAAYKKAMAATSCIENLFSVSHKMLRVIAYVFEKLEEVTPLMLQKLLYFIQGIYSALYGKPIFEEDCRAWIHGPVGIAMIKISGDFVFLQNMTFRQIKPADDTAVAELIRRNLKAHGLDIPGTVYFDENLYHLSDYYYAEPKKRVYFVLVDDEDQVMGGVGIAEFQGIEDCAELQKLYLDDRVKGQGLSYNMIEKAEAAALECGYKRIYLETHDHLGTAIHLYEKCGYTEIDRPESVVHSTMNRFFLKEL